MYTQEIISFCPQLNLIKCVDYSINLIPFLLHSISLLNFDCTNSIFIPFIIVSRYFHNKNVISSYIRMEFKIGEKKIGGAISDCFIIAEIGQNHQGNLETAKRMILAAKVQMCCVYSY